MDLPGKRKQILWWTRRYVGLGTGMVRWGRKVMTKVQGDITGIVGYLGLDVETQHSRNFLYPMRVTLTSTSQKSMIRCLMIIPSSVSGKASSVGTGTSAQPQNHSPTPVLVQDVLGQWCFGTSESGQPKTGLNLRLKLQKEVYTVHCLYGQVPETGWLRDLGQNQTRLRKKKTMKLF